MIRGVRKPEFMNTSRAVKTI